MAKVKPAKAYKPYKAPKPIVKVSGIEKSTTVIPLKQLPMKKKEEPAPAPAAEPVPTKEEALLTEIRDLLAAGKK